MKKTIFKKWQDAFKAKELDSKVLPDVSMLPVQYRKSVVAQYILNVVIDVANDGWIADYTDISQPKYELWLEVIADAKRPSGFGLSLDYVVAGVRLRLSACGLLSKIERLQRKFSRIIRNCLRICICLITNKKY